MSRELTRGRGGFWVKIFEGGEGNKGEKLWVQGGKMLPQETLEEEGAKKDVGEVKRNYSAVIGNNCPTCHKNSPGTLI